MFRDLIVLSLGAILIENFVLVRFLGICPFLGVSKKVETALGMGMAVTFVMTLASFLTWITDKFILVNLNIEFARTIAFILVIAVLVQFVEMALQKISPPLYKALGIYLPLITTNCAVLGAAIININQEFDLIKSVVFGFMSAVGFTLAIVLFSGIRERLESSKIPKALKGFPIALITAGLMSIAFMGFTGFKL